MIGILALDHFFDQVIHKLPGAFKIFYPDNLQQARSQIQGIMTTPWTKTDALLIEKLPHLKIISCFGVGIDSTDAITAKKRGITITNTPDVVTDDTADIAMALLLCLSRKILFNDSYVRSGKWKIASAPLTSSLFGKTLGIVGLGKIGKAIAERAKTFGLKIIYHSKTKKDTSYRFYSNLIEMAKESDFLIICCTGENKTRDIVNLNILQALGKKGYLINISRGMTVNEADLIFALENNIIAGAGLDVYLHEPHVPEQLIKMEQVVLLPHIGTATKETRNIMLNLVIDNIQSFFKSGKALTPVNF